MIRCLDELTHFKENSISTSDVTNKESVLTSGVKEPCLYLTMCFHCPVFGVFNLLKHKIKNIHRTIWKHELRNYNE